MNESDPRSDVHITARITFIHRSDLFSRYFLYFPFCLVVFIFAPNMNEVKQAKI